MHIVSIPSSTRRRSSMLVMLALCLVLMAAPAGVSADPGATSAAPVGFVQTATSANTSGAGTLIDNVATNGLPGAIAFVTANRSPGGPVGTIYNNPVGLLYNSSAAKWGVVNENQANMSVGATFNVQVSQDPSTGFVQTQTNAGSFYTALDSPLTNANPNALVFVTYNSGATGGAVTYNNPPLGVFYSTDDLGQERWFIWNQDSAPLPAGVKFNVMVLSAGSAAFVHLATAANTSSNRTTLDAPSANNNPNAVIVVTQNWNPGNQGGVANPHNVGVTYDSVSGRWSIFNEDGAAMPMGAGFNVSIVSATTVIPVPVVSIAKAGSDVHLSWPNVSSAITAYEVWRSTKPYFAPGDTGAEKLLPDVLPPFATPVSRDDLNVFTGGINYYYYRVRAVAGSTLSDPSNRVGAFVFGLVRGG